jgi:hypothetical protein
VISSKYLKERISTNPTCTVSGNKTEGTLTKNSYYEATIVMIANFHRSTTIKIASCAFSGI